MHAVISPHHFDFDVRFLCISALMLKTIHQSQILRWVLSVIYAYYLIKLPNSFSTILSQLKTTQWILFPSYNFIFPIGHQQLFFFHFIEALLIVPPAFQSRVARTKAKSALKSELQGHCLNTSTIKCVLKGAIVVSISLLRLRPKRG